MSTKLFLSFTILLGSALSLDLTFTCGCELPPPVSCRSSGIFNEEITNDTKKIFLQCSMKPSSVHDLHLSWVREGISCQFHEFIHLKEFTMSKSVVNKLITNLFAGLQQLNKLVISGNEIKELEQFAQLTNLEKLFMIDNKVEVIRKETFTNLTSLKLLTIERNEIFFIHADAFEGNENLEELNLNENLLSSLEESIFHRNVNLMEISLNHNSIEYLSPRTFSRNFKLEILRLHANKLQSIAKNFFKHNVNLRWVELGENSLQFIDSNVFKNLENLEFVDFSFNDCIDDSFPIEMNFEHVQQLIKRNCHHLAAVYYEIV